MNGSIAISTGVGKLDIEAMTYEEIPSGDTSTYAIHARIPITRTAGEEVTYVTLYRTPHNAGGPTGAEEYVDEMYWYQTGPAPDDDVDFYEGYDYGYYIPASPATHWKYHAKVFITKTYSKNSLTEDYPSP